MQSSNGRQQGIIECPVEVEKSVRKTDPKIENRLHDLERAYHELDKICKERSGQMGQLETDMVTRIHRYQICIVLLGVFSFFSYWGHYPEGTVGGGIAGILCLLAIIFMIFTQRHKKKRQSYLSGLQREDHESMRRLQEQMTELREQLYFDKK